MTDRPLRIAKITGDRPSDVTTALDHVYHEVDATLELIPHWNIMQALGKTEWQGVQRARPRPFNSRQAGDA